LLERKIGEKKSKIDLSLDLYSLVLAFLTKFPTTQHTHTQIMVKEASCTLAFSWHTPGLKIWQLENYKIGDSPKTCQSSNLIPCYILLI